jgi:hypothetical protein
MRVFGKWPLLGIEGPATEIPMPPSDHTPLAASFVNSERGFTPMLAEKFFLVLEMLKSFSTDGSPIVVSTARHIPIKLPPRRT